MEEYKAEGYAIVDIAGARITPDIALLINEYNKGCIQFTDTECAETKQILDYNYQISSLEDMPKEMLPQYKLGSSIPDYIQNLDSNKIYTIDATNKEIYIPLATLVMLTRPSIRLYVDKYLDEILKSITRLLYIEGPTRMAETTNDFQYLYKGSLVQFSTDVKDETTLFHVYGIGYVTWLTLIEEYIVVPKYVSEENVFEVDSELWFPVYNEILNIIKSIRKPITLAQFVKGADLYEDD